MAAINRIKSAIKKITPGFVIGWYHLGWAFAAAVRYGFPSRKIKVIGVTGTNGKSTTIEFVLAVLREAGYKVASLSSIAFRVGDEVEINKTGNTMPGRLAVQRVLARAAKAKCDYAVLEVTSEGIKQSRHRFIDFAGAVITNLTPEHIESHGGFDNYRKAKQQLFKIAKGFHAVNCDDDNAKYFLEFDAENKFCYGVKSHACECRGGKTIIAENVHTDLKSSRFTLEGQEFEVNLPGEFNVYNALAAIGVAASQGIGLDVCRKAVASVNKVPGRMEMASDNPRVFVDFAFTPNALEKVYATLRHDLEGKGGKLVCLLGACGGGRDKWKRPVLGKIAAKYCNSIILTNEDPYDEEPQKIIDGVKSGVEEAGFAGELAVIVDRRQAIRQAVARTGPQDIAILTGKGSMPWTFLEQGKKVPWDEKKIVGEELAAIGQEK
ncbi:MAG: UDP-N-acetylmuramoyl-L-alanyl-D-glutamate--2,6-diaminopimelate ligase [Candidatus Pacebacteria bacterium]|jgi:UDP-N-acetylmuramoyl-L-alanyl-D-glutamate--2,6-diaminopimelate ligase|nr:UDP-N-acetylmuramoyl-L-alanyl-D-glutamate--2,6-diaminopimelate ligase [Candidatus Paceibacterota bacterium]